MKSRVNVLFFFTFSTSSPRPFSYQRRGVRIFLRLPPPIRDAAKHDFRKSQTWDPTGWRGIEGAVNVNQEITETFKKLYLYIKINNLQFPKGIDAKAADIVLAKTFHELGINATVNKERANCADVLGKSNQHGYTLVGDAKAFRLSRTAKNQKDFKVKSMEDWKGDNDYSVLVCPYYQYPKSNSQIYGQALDGNVCLLSWEHLALFLDSNICESKTVNLSKIWNISSRIGEKVTIKDKDKNTNFHEMGNEFICEDLKINPDKMKGLFSNCRKGLVYRGEVEIDYWKNRIVEIKKFSKEKAIGELIIALKLNEKISAIKKFIDSLRN